MASETDHVESQGPGGGDSAPSLAVGDRVRLRPGQPYLKTADPMPMLRPPDLVDPEEPGQVVEIRALGMLAVRFRRGTFLIDGHQLIPLDPPEGENSPPTMDAAARHAPPPAGPGQAPPG